MGTRKKMLQQFWEQEKSLTILFFILVVHIFIVIPFGQKTMAGQIIFLAVYISLLAAGMSLLVKNLVLRRLLTLLLAVLMLLGSDFFLKSAAFEVADNLVVILYSLMLSWVVLLRTFSDGPVTIHRIIGAVVVYLLVSLIFASLYHSIYLIHGETAFKGLDSADRKEFMYFSLTTLTTVGYGDISGAIASARSLSNLEALLGQLYPAILIARLVSMEFESSKSRG